jgi:hypothetical protein
VGEVDRDGVVRPLILTVASMPLATWLAQPGESDCAARALARRPALSVGGRYRAFFLHTCAGMCTGGSQFADAWNVVVQDRSTGQVSVSTDAFATPHALAVSDSGQGAVSAGYRGAEGIWYCTSAACTEPEQLAKGAFTSPDFSPNHDKLVAARIGGTHPEMINLPRA